MKTIEVEHGMVEGEKRLLLYFPYDQELITLVRTIPGARWNRPLKCWHISYAAGPVEKLNEKFTGMILFNLVESDPAINKTVSTEECILRVPDEMIKTLKLRQYSQNTIKTYISMFKMFMKYYSEKQLDEITEEEIRDYLLFLVEKKNVSQSHQNQSINAIKFYYEKVLGQAVKKYYIQRPKREKKLPIVCSVEEVAAILKGTANLKHKCILYLIYSAGLRLSEVIHLRPEDIDSDRMTIHIRNAKGKKDRISLLSDRALTLLRQYYKEYRPKTWLFEGQFGNQYSKSSVQKILRAALGTTNIRKKVTVHTLRHSFATHLLESGVDLRYIQNFLGHESTRTTQIYTHITKKGIEKIKSPLDNLDI